jgi:hypothetical protein
MTYDKGGRRNHASGANHDKTQHPVCWNYFPNRTPLPYLTLPAQQLAGPPWKRPWPTTPRNWTMLPFLIAAVALLTKYATIILGSPVRTRNYNPLVNRRIANKGEIVEGSGWMQSRKRRANRADDELLTGGRQFRVRIGRQRLSLRIGSILPLLLAPVANTAK